MENILPILQQSYFGNTLYTYCEAVLFFFLSVLLIHIIRNSVIAKLKELAEKTETTFDDFIIEIISKVVVPLLYFGVFYMASNLLVLGETYDKLFSILSKAIVTIFVARFIVELLNYGVKVYLRTVGFEENSRKSFMGIIRVTKLIVWALAVISFFDSMGFKVTGIIAGLGIGGVAVAMAAQAVLKDLFSYFAILFDRPFEIGDFIIVDDKMGVVENIGIKTTRINSLGGEQIVFSNADLTDSRVQNYRRMVRRRVLFQIGVTYGTDYKKLQEIPEIIEAIVRGVTDTEFDRAHFQKYGPYSLDFEVVYYVLGNDYTKYMNIQQEINLKIHEAFTKMGVEFAFPTQTVHLQQDK